MNGITIAMWSGPRNISTAMMRSFENREDTVVLDEPFYAYYLKNTNLAHPGKKKIIASQNNNWSEVVKICTKSFPNEKKIWYQKQMAQHILDGDSIDWIDGLRNCLLIRDPKLVINSYMKQFPLENINHLGYPQLCKILDHLEKKNGESPPIIDADDLLKNPKKILKKLCQKLEICFSSRMLSWPKGKRESDGVWAEHWYGRVVQTTGFDSHRKRKIKLDPILIPIYDSCMKYYEKMYKRRITL
ncbi:MAG: sulfotransferase family protein [Rickettsiales bacterium]|nr:sulfotransferase family protein [Rickettsiales bacterium]